MYAIELPGLLDGGQETSRSRAGVDVVDEAADGVLAGGMNGLALMRAIDWRTSFVGVGEGFVAAHSGLMPVSSWTERLNSSSVKVEHAAVGVVDEDDLLGAE